MHAPLAAVEAESMGRPPKDTVQITFRVPTAWLERAERIAKKIAPPGAEFGRTDALRAAIAKGFDHLEEVTQEIRVADRPDMSGEWRSRMTLLDLHGEQALTLHRDLVMSHNDVSTVAFIVAGPTGMPSQGASFAELREIVSFPSGCWDHDDPDICFGFAPRHVAADLVRRWSPHSGEADLLSGEHAAGTVVVAVAAGGVTVVDLPHDEEHFDRWERAMETAKTVVRQRAGARAPIPPPVAAKKSKSKR